MTSTGSFTELWLASGSPRRIALLRQIGLDPRVCKPGYQEPPISGLLSPSEVVIMHAKNKAESVRPDHSGIVVLGADTIVVCENRILGKPSDRCQAEDMLALLSGRTHRVFSGIAFSSLSGRTITRHAVSTVHFRLVSESERRFYLETGEWKDKAGAYGIQGYAAAFITRILGCYFNVVGLPLSLTVQTLRTHFPGIWPPKA